MSERTAQNTDRELWRESPGDYYANSIHVTEAGGIGINVGGKVFVKSLAQWHKLAEEAESERAEQGGALPVTPADKHVDQNKPLTREDIIVLAALMGPGSSPGYELACMDIRVILERNIARFPERAPERRLTPLNEDPDDDQSSRYRDDG